MNIIMKYCLKSPKIEQYNNVPPDPGLYYVPFGYFIQLGKDDDESGVTPERIIIIINV